MVINTNSMAQAAATQLSTASQRLSQSLGRLSSGSKIISPADDSAGLAVSMKLGAQISRTDAALTNLGNATSFAQTQDGYLAKINDALTRMSELTVAAQDVTKTTSDRQIYNQEFQALGTYINDVVTKDFNGVSLFSGNALGVTTDADDNTFQMTGINGNYVLKGTTTPGTTTPWSTSSTMGQLSPGFTRGDFGTNHYVANVYAFNTLGSVVSNFNSTMAGGGGGAAYDSTTGTLSVTIGAGDSLQHQSYPDNVVAALGLHDVDNSLGSSPVILTSTLATTTPGTTTGGMDISSVSGAKSALTTIKNSINQLATDRATVGSNLTRLNYTTDQLSALKNNLTAATSRITDVDVAQESTNYAKANILVQSGTAMLAQANSMPQSVLRLLG